MLRIVRAYGFPVRFRQGRNERGSAPPLPSRQWFESVRRQVAEREVNVYVYPMCMIAVLLPFANVVLYLSFLPLSR